MTVHDVLIVGAGPAGSALAIHLARQGRDVLLIDRAEFPREKACGEGIVPAGVAALERLGVEVHGVPFHGLRYRHGQRLVHGEFPGGHFGLGIRRRDLDAALFEAARAERNVTVLTGIRVDAPLFECDRVTGVRAADLEFRATLTIAADGANSALRHKLGWDASKPTRRHGMRRHYRATEPAPDWVEVWLNPDYETYITPLPNQELLVATLGNAHAEPEGLEPIDQPLGAAPLTVRAHTRVGAGCVLLGDAAGNCDPITGGGVTHALLTAELLATHLREFPPTLDTLRAFDYEREQLLRSFRRLTAGVLALNRHPSLTDPALALLSSSPWLFSRLLGIAGGI